MIDYSQSGEQDLILGYFQNDKPQKFLDIGAGDGEKFSNTAALAGLAWSGVLVEPNARDFEKLETRYGNFPNMFTLVNAAIGPCWGLREFWYSRIACVSTLSPQHRDAWKESGDYRPIQIGTVPPEELLRVCPGPYSLISVDAEGLSGFIVRALPLVMLQCRLICYEPDPHDCKETREYLCEQGFALHGATANNELWRRTT